MPVSVAPQVVQRYRARVSGPLLDRIDIHLEVPAIPYRDLTGVQPAEPSRDIAVRVERARTAQRARFDGIPGMHANAHMSAREVRRFCGLGADSEAILRSAITRLGLSARAYHRVLKIARTIADLAGAESLRGCARGGSDPVPKPRSRSARAVPAALSPS